MSEEQGTNRLPPPQDCDERPSDGPVWTSAAGPARADEGVGPTPGRLRRAASGSPAMLTSLSFELPPPPINGARPSSTMQRSGARSRASRRTPR